MELYAKMTELRRSMGRVIKGKDEVIELLLTALAAEGHVLLEDVPGVGKTTLVKALAAGLSCAFNRVQFTPDLLPGDLLGSSIYNPSSGELTFRPGPVFTNILLADEINRASPRTQSALLEAMSERQVSLEGRTTPLGRPFWVLATENPIEYQGTYPLPEAQLDRFMMRLEIGYPGEEAEFELLVDRLRDDPLDAVAGILDAEQVVAIQREVRQVKVDDSIGRYLVELVRATRGETRLMLGASPRALVAWCRAAQAAAWMRNRDFVIPDDVKQVAPAVLPHRLIADNPSRYAGVDTREIAAEILGRVRVPR